MPEWAAASTTDLAGLFGDSPPPLPVSEISRWTIYALARFPLVGLAVQALASSAVSARSGQDVQEVFDHRAWWLLFVIGNGVLGEFDERSLQQAGSKLRGASVFAALLAPAYIFASCRTFKRHGGRSASFVYLPVVPRSAALITSVVIEPLLFDPDAPRIFRPNEWM